MNLGTSFGQRSRGFERLVSFLVPLGTAPFLGGEGGGESGLLRLGWVLSVREEEAQLS